MKLKKYIVVVIVIAVMCVSLLYGYSQDYEKALDDYEKEHGEMLVRHLVYRLLFFVVVIIFFVWVLAYDKKKKVKEKEESRKATREIISTELDKRVTANPILKTCENCGRSIGKLEKSCDYKGNIVCTVC